MNRFLLCLAAAAGALVFAVLPFDRALAQRRVALVIGNSAYQNVAQLSNTINDANAIATLFRKVGFDFVDERENLGVVEFKRAVRDFMAIARGAETAVIYFAGHGIEVSGTNYLIPVDAKLATDFDAEDEAVSLDRMVLALEPAQRLRLVILDACRENPFLRKMQRAVAVRAVASGLGKIEPMSTDTLIAYAAKAGSVSYDGFGPNSPFTTAVIKHITEPGLDIRIALGRVRDEVLKITGNQQEPFVYGSLGGTTVALVPAADATKPEHRQAGGEDEVRRAYELASQLGTKEAWESFLKAFRTGFYAELARLQLAKLSAAPVPDAAVGRETRAKSKQEQAERPAPAQRQDEERRAKVDEEAQRLNAQREAVLQSQRDDQSKDRLSCADEEKRIAQLRANPVREEVVRFARELKCAALRQQLGRLLESVGGELSAPAPSLTRPTPIENVQPAATERRESGSGSEPGAREQVCRREQERLLQLRANPAREEVARFARELVCENLRPQVQRLLESVGG